MDITTRTLRVRALVPNPMGRIMPGSFAKTSLMLGTYSNAFVIPAQAVVPKLEGQMVYLVKNGKCVSSDIEITMRTDSSVVVTQGLSTDDSLIISGLLQVRIHAPVLVSRGNKSDK